MKMAFARGRLSDGTMLQVQFTSERLTQDELSEYVRAAMVAARRCCAELKERQRVILSLEIAAPNRPPIPLCRCGRPIVHVGAGTCGAAACLNDAIECELQTLHTAHTCELCGHQSCGAECDCPCGHDWASCACAWCVNYRRAEQTNG